MVKKVKGLNNGFKEDDKANQLMDGSEDHGKEEKVLKTKTHIYVQDNDINLSDLEDEE